MHCRYNSDERKVFGEQHPVIMQAFRNPHPKRLPAATYPIDENRATLAAH
jgi:hypothetical protein